jgi:hypothetical protein
MDLLIITSCTLFSVFEKFRVNKMDFEASYTPAPKKKKRTNIYIKRPLS